MFSFFKNLIWRNQRQEHTERLTVDRKRKVCTQHSEVYREEEAKRLRPTAVEPGGPSFNSQNRNISNAKDVEASNDLLASFRAKSPTVLICRTNSISARGDSVRSHANSLYDSYFVNKDRHTLRTDCSAFTQQSQRVQANSVLRQGSVRRSSTVASTPLMSKSASVTNTAAAAAADSAAAAAIGVEGKISPIKSTKAATAAANDNNNENDDDCIITGEESQNSVATKFVPCKYFSPNWLQEIKVSSQSLKSYRQRVEADEKLKAQYWAKKRAAEEQDLVHRVERSLQLSQRQVPLVPYKYEEVPAAAAVEEEFPELSDEQEKLVTIAWSRQLSGSETLAEGFGIRISRDDLRTLHGLNWLNDNVINFYMQLLAARAQASQDSLPSVHAFSTFFYTKLCNGGQSAVRRWTRKVDIFSKAILLCPVNLHNSHWTLCIIDLRYKQIHYYDSIASSANPSCLPMLKQYLHDEHLDKKSAGFDTSAFQLINNDTVPQQSNSSDCGIFCCKFADYYCKDKEFTFNQKHMPYFRKRIVAEIMDKKLLW